MKRIHLFTITIITYFITSPVFAFTLAFQTSSIPGFSGWNTRKLTVAVNYTNCGIAQATLDQIIDDAFALWNGVPTSGIKVERSGTSTSSAAAVYGLTAPDNPVIACDTAFTTTTSSSGSTLGLARSTATSAGYITTGGIVLNVEAAQSGNITTKTETQIAITIAHEVGHLLGLGHSSDTHSLMYYSIGVKDTLSLSQDDVDGISYLYPRDELGTDSIFGCGTITTGGGSGSSDGGSGALGGFAIFLVMITAFYVWSRRSSNVC